MKSLELIAAPALSAVAAVKQQAPNTTMHFDFGDLLVPAALALIAYFLKRLVTSIDAKLDSHSKHIELIHRAIDLCPECTKSRRKAWMHTRDTDISWVGKEGDE